MGRRAGVITVDFVAGTGKFTTDVEKARAKVQQFGTSTKFNMAESTAAVKALEGNFGGTTRAVSRFLSVTLGLGPVLEKAFPYVGAVFLGKAVLDTGMKVGQFFKQMQEAPEKINRAFREMNGPLRISNDELRVTADRLENDIAKLEGKRQNTLKLALDEAKLAADNLAKSLDKDLEELQKLMEGQAHIGLAQAIFGAKATTGTDEEEAKKFRITIERIDAEGAAAVRAAKTAQAAKAAQVAWDKKALDALDEEIGKLEKLTEGTRKIKEAQDSLAKAPKPDLANRGSDYTRSVPRADVAGLLEERQGRLEALNAARDRYSLTSTVTDLTNQKQALEADAANAALGRPFSDRMKALAAQLAGVKAKMDAIGTSESGEVAAKAYGEAAKAIEEVNKALESQHRQLTATEKLQILSAESAIAQAEAEVTWKTKLDQSTTAIELRIAAQERLTAAIGKAYEATRQANIETKLMQELGDKASDPEWMKAHAKDIGQLRSGISKEFDAANKERNASATDALNRQIELEKSLAQVQSLGAEAVARVTLAYRLRQLVAQGATAAQIRAEIDLFEATRKTSASADLAKLDQRAQASERLAAAQLQGAEAERKAALENKYAAMVQEGKSPQVIAAERAADILDRQREVTQEAVKTGLEYQNHLEALDQEIARLQEIHAEGNDSLALAISLRNLERERLDTLSKQSRAMGGIKDGIRSVFQEMAVEAQSAADLVYESLKSAIDRTNDEFAKLLTGQKTDFGRMLQEMGTGLVRNSLKFGEGALAQKLAGKGGKLGKLGVILGGKSKEELAKPDGTQAKPLYTRFSPDSPDGSAARPFHVIVDNAGGGGGLPGVAGQAAAKAPGFVSTLLGSLFGALASTGAGAGGEGVPGSTPQVTSTVNYGTVIPDGGGRAAGGMVSPGEAYLVGERGPEIFTPASHGEVMSNALAQRSFGGSNRPIIHYGPIDARGTDPVMVDQNIRRTLQAIHGSAVSASIRTEHDRQRRTPQRTR